jgi:putative sigma-54 modulation protein
MEIHFTARKFKAHDTIRNHAIESVKKLDKFYDGIVRGDIILSYERPTQSVKKAEINLHVFGTHLTAKEKSDDFFKSIDLTIVKLEHQLEKYKTKLRGKDKKVLRRTKEALPIPETGDEE